MKSEPSDGQLNSLLCEWKIDMEPDSGFSNGVWRRIGQREAEVHAASRCVRFLKWTKALSQRTDLAWGAVAAVIITIGAGWMGFRTGSAQPGSPPSSSYLALVDPYRMVR